jgi:hypothetical protein
VACRPVAGQRPRKNHLYNNHHQVTLRKQARFCGNNREQQQSKGVFCAVLAEMLQAGQLVEFSQLEQWSELVDK